MGRSGSSSGSNGNEKAKRKVSAKGRLDVLAERLLSTGIQMVEQRNGMRGLEEWARPLVKGFVRELGIPRKRLF